MQKESFKLFIACFVHGPTSGHLALIEDLLKSTFINLCYYIKVSINFLQKHEIVCTIHVRVDYIFLLVCKQTFFVF